MPRVLVCQDETPSVDGTCAVQVWQEMPTLLPELTQAQVYEICGYMAAILATAWCFKQLTRTIFR